MVTLYASEDLEDLNYGTGDYTDEQLADPFAVIDGYWKRAHELVREMVAEAARVLGEPASPTPGARTGANWLLPDRTISVGATQAEKECPIEVCVWLLPPGRISRHLGL